MSIEVEQAPDIVQQLRETLHDMRQPVATTLALAAAALTDRDLPAAASERLREIVRQAELLADMIHCCLAADGQEEPDEIEDEDLTCTDIVQLVREVITAECLTWAGDIALTSPAEPVWCMFHPVLMRRVVSNVLGNATRAAGPAGTVTVEIRQRRGTAMLMVEDSGPGFGNIPSGAGLGLSAVARNIVKYGGTMECRRGVRGGARVSLGLP